MPKYVVLGEMFMPVLRARSTCPYVDKVVCDNRLAEWRERSADEAKPAVEERPRRSGCSGSRWIYNVKIIKQSGNLIRFEGINACCRVRSPNGLC